MFRLPILIALVTLAGNAAADSFYTVAKVECDKTGDFVAVRYLGAYNGKGIALLEGRDGNGVKLWKPVKDIYGKTLRASKPETEFDPLKAIEAALHGEVFELGPNENAIDPRTLIEVANDRIIVENSVTMECPLSDGTYLVKLGPLPGNPNIQGHCGAEMAAWAEFYRDNELLIRSGSGSDCLDLESTITTRVLWRAGATTAEIAELPYFDFYK